MEMGCHLGRNHRPLRDDDGLDQGGDFGGGGEEKFES